MSPIKHIEFWVSNLEESLKFYSKLFEIIKWEQTADNAFTKDGLKIYFIQEKAGMIKVYGPRHICFLANNIEMVNNVASLIKDYNLTIINGPTEYECNSKTAYTVDFKDPDNYILEVATKSV